MAQTLRSHYRCYSGNGVARQLTSNSATGSRVLSSHLTFDRRVCTVASALGQDGDLYFSVSPGEHSVVEGSPVRLRCEAQPSSRVKYAWKIDGQPLAPSPRRHQDGSDLRITRVNRIFDSGKFVCVATHDDTGYSIESSPAKIDIQCEFSSPFLYHVHLRTAIGSERFAFASFAIKPRR